jgi:hypothetical protein
VLPWDERRAARAEDAATPDTASGLLKSLRLDQPAAATTSQVGIARDGGRETR